MEVPIRYQFEPLCLDKVLENQHPHDCCKSVATDFAHVLSNLPLVRRHQDDPAGQGLNPSDTMIRSYLINVITEIVEIRDSIKSLSPFLRKSQQIVQSRVFAYARNHTPFSRRVQSLRSRKSSQNADNDDNSSKSFFVRAWQFFVNTVISGTSKRSKENSDKEKVKEAFEKFYCQNGINFRWFMAQNMARCKRIEMLLFSIKQQIKQFDIFREAELNDNVAGIACQMRVHRGHLSHWRKDFDYVWKQAKHARRLLCLVPLHNCWEAIFNIMTSQGQLNHYI